MGHTLSVTTDRKGPGAAQPPELAEPPEAAEPTTARRRVKRVTKPARKAMKSIRSGMSAAADGMAAAADGMAAAAEPLVGRIEQAVDDVERALAERPGARVRRVRRMGTQPLAYLNDVHPDVAPGAPDAGRPAHDPGRGIAGTAVGGGAQRGGDFLPLNRSAAGTGTVAGSASTEPRTILRSCRRSRSSSMAVTTGSSTGTTASGWRCITGNRRSTRRSPSWWRPANRCSEPIVDLRPGLRRIQALRTAGGGHRPSDLSVARRRDRPGAPR